MYEKQLYTIKELAAVNGGPLPMSESGIYNACRCGIIKSCRIGRRIFVPLHVVKELLRVH